MKGVHIGVGLKAFCSHEIFDRLKTAEPLHKVRHRGRARVHWLFVFAAAIYNLVRIRNLAEGAG